MLREDLSTNDDVIVVETSLALECSRIQTFVTATNELESKYTGVGSKSMIPLGNTFPLRLSIISCNQVQLVVVEYSRNRLVVERFDFIITHGIALSYRAYHENFS